MPLLLDLTDTLARFPVPYGYQPVRGWPVKHFETLLGQSVQLTKQQALGEGPWDGVEKLYADAFEIPSSDYVFHNGIGTDSADAFFPDEEPHPWTAHINARCPAGISKDQADKLFGIYRTLRTANYDGAGVQIDINSDPIGGGDPRDYYFFKPNPANAAIDQLLRWGQREAALINYPAFVDWRDFNDELIPWDDTAYTPRSLSLTGASGGSLTPGQIYYVRVSAMKTADQSSASRQTVEIAASDITLSGGQSAFQVNWLVKGDELDPPVPQAGITAFRVYVGTVPGVWLGYFTVANPALRSLLITTTAGVTAGNPLDTCSVGLMRDIPRFECGLFFVPPYSLSAALDRICQISCADWQWSGWDTSTYRNDKVRFLSPASRTPVFTLDLSQTAPGSFRTWAVDRRQRPNQVVVNFRDRDDEFLSEGTPVVRNRETMQADDGIVKTVTIDCGTAYRSQAERVASFYARTLCDMDQLAALKGSPKTYHVLPADVVYVTNDTPDWEDVEFLIRKKSENVESALGDPLVMQLYAGDAYSDTNHSALPRPLRRARFDPLSAPPVATNLVLTADNTLIAGIIGDFDFGVYPAKQVARIFIKGPADTEPDDSTYRMVAVVDPNDSLEGHFELRAIVGGQYWVKVQTESALGVTAPSGHPVESIDIVALPVTDVVVAQDGYGDKLIQFVDHPRASEKPADCAVEIWVDEDRDAPVTDLKGTLPVTRGTSHACLLNATPFTGGGALPPEEEEGGGGTTITTAHLDRNNLITSVGTEFDVAQDCEGVTLEQLDDMFQNFQQFDFTIQWSGANGPMGGGDNQYDADFSAVVGLQTRANADPVSGGFAPVLTSCPLSVEWSVGTLAGTIKETYRSFNVIVATRDNVDPGKADLSQPSVTRPGPRYTFLLSGTEYRAIVDYPRNRKPEVIIASPPEGLAFPLRLAGKVNAPNDFDEARRIGITNITAAGNLKPTTIFSVRDQIEKFGSPQSRIYLRIYQLPDGIPVDVVAPPL